MIHNNLNSGGALFRVKGIIQCVNRRDIARKNKDILIALQRDETCVAGRKVADYATALLAHSGIEPYTGSDAEMSDLIKAMPTLAKYCN